MQVKDKHSMEVLSASLTGRYIPAAGINASSTTHTEQLEDSMRKQAEWPPRGFTHLPQSHLSVTLWQPSSGSGKTDGQRDYIHWIDGHQLKIIKSIFNFSLKNAKGTCCCCFPEGNLEK